MNEGSYKIVYRVSLGILKYFEQQLLELKFDKIMALLRDLPRHIDANRLMEVICRVCFWLFSKCAFSHSMYDVQPSMLRAKVDVTYVF